MYGFTRSHVVWVNVWMHNCTSNDTHSLRWSPGYLQTRARESRGHTAVESNRGGCKPQLTEIWDRQDRMINWRTVNVRPSPAG